MSNKDYKIGDTITYTPFGGGKRTGTVDEKEDDIKNGRPGFGLAEGYWGYDDQITKVAHKD
jgi:hypothetical protein